MDKFEEIVEWFYDECFINKVETLEDVYDIYVELKSKIREEDILIECEDLSIDDFADPVDCTRINDEYRLTIEIPALSENIVFLFSYLKIDGKYGVDLEYTEGVGSKLEQYFTDPDES